MTLKNTKKQYVKEYKHGGTFWNDGDSLCCDSGLRLACAGLLLPQYELVIPKLSSVLSNLEQTGKYAEENPSHFPHWWRKEMQIKGRKEKAESLQKF